MTRRKGEITTAISSANGRITWEQVGALKAAAGNAISAAQTRCA